MLKRLKRVHATGTEALLTQHLDRWRIQINLREPNGSPGTLRGYKATTVEMAKALAEKEIIKHGRLINPPPSITPPPAQKMPPEKPPKQVVIGPDVAPPLPGALGGAPA